jgi:hypothetical protein
LLRHSALEGLSLYELYSGFETIQCTPEQEPDGFLKLRHKFDGGIMMGHVRRNRTKVITLPWFNGKSVVHGYGTENFARLAITLFKPFRQATDLYVNMPFIDYLMEWIGELDLTSKPYIFLQNLCQDSLVAKDSLKERTKKECADLVEDEAVIPMNDDGERINWTRIDYFTTPSIDFDRNLIERESTLKTILSAQKELHTSLMPKQKQFDSILQRIVYDSGIDYEKEIERVLVAERSDSTCSKQWVLVRYFAQHVLDLVRHSQGTHWRKREPLRLMILGAGGTGKSWVIKVMQKILTVCSVKFATVAPTGKAAINVDGDTIDSVFGLQSRKGILSFG